MGVVVGGDGIGGEESGEARRGRGREVVQRGCVDVRLRVGGRVKEGKVFGGH